jgi:hypothetical protein
MTLIIQPTSLPFLPFSLKFVILTLLDIINVLS